MEAVLHFLRAALPWISMGLLLAVFCAKGAGKKKKDDQTDNYGTEGMCLGMCFGTAIENTGIGLSLGMLIGLALGSCIPKKDQGKDNGEK